MRLCGRILGVLICLILFSPDAARGQETFDRVSVQGIAERQTVPDIAYLTFGVVTEAGQAEEARQDNAVRSARLAAALRSSGIAGEDIKTTSFNLRPLYSPAERQPRRITGYAVDNILTVRVRADELGAVIDKALSSGANRFDGVQFALSEAAAWHSELLREAVNDGCEKARTLAEAAGRTLGPARQISLMVDSRPLPVRSLTKPYQNSSDGIEIFAGELKLRVEVSLVYELK
jgi:uncharacterized protein YggE